MDDAHLDRRIVVIDDNPRFMILVKSLLREFGFRFIHEFTDPQSAFLFLTQVHVDVALVDLVMPKASGFQFADRVRHADVVVNRVVPLILMTGHASANNVQKAINHGIDEVLVKPFSPRQLHDRLIGVLGKPRVYIKTPSGYFGPDRRRRQDPHYTGPERRKQDMAMVITEDHLVEMRHIAKVKYGRLPPSPLEPIPLPPVLVGPITTIPVVGGEETAGGRAVVKVPTPIRQSLVAAAADAPPARLRSEPPAKPEFDGLLPKVPVAKPPPPKPKSPVEDVHYID